MKKFSLGLFCLLFLSISIIPNTHSNLSTHLAPSTFSQPESDSFDFLAHVQSHFREAAESLRVQMNKKQIREILRPDRTIEVTIPVIMDNNTVELFQGWRVQHSFLRGPAKGGIRVIPGLTQNTVQALATEMTIKSAISNLPLGGGKGGINADHRRLSEGELARMMRSYVEAVMSSVWKKDKDLAFHVLRDAPAPDYGTSPAGFNLMNVAADELLRWYLKHSEEYMHWLNENVPIEEAYIYQLPKQLLDVTEGNGRGLKTPYLDTYLSLKAKGLISNVSLIGAFTGKEIVRGGSQGRTEATGTGIAYSALELIKHDLNLPDSTRYFPQLKNNQLLRVAVQGFGNVGSYAAEAFTELGAKVVAIAEYDIETQKPYALYKANGFSIEDLQALRDYRAEHRTLKGAPIADKELTLDQFWALGDIDILSPSATQNQITGKNAHLIQARYVVEGANGPTTSEADAILEQNGILVLPDVFANGGGVTVSYFEMEQNVSGKFLEKRIINEKLREKIIRNFNHLVSIQAESGDVSLREAVHIMGLQRIKQRLMKQTLVSQPLYDMEVVFTQKYAESL